MQKKCKKNDPIRFKYAVVLMLCIIVMACVSAPLINAYVSNVRIEFDEQIEDLNILVYYPSGRLLDPNKYNHTESTNCVILNDLPNGVWWIALEHIISNYDTSHIDAYKFVAENDKIYSFCIPKDKVGVRLYTEINDGFHKVWMKVQRYDGDLVDPVFRKWSYLVRDRSLEEAYQSYMNINVGSQYLLTFYQSNDYIDKFIGSMSIDITDEYKDCMIEICMKHIKKEIQNNSSLSNILNN